MVHIHLPRAQNTVAKFLHRASLKHPLFFVWRSLITCYCVCISTHCKEFKGQGGLSITKIVFTQLNSSLSYTTLYKDHFGMRISNLTKILKTTSKCTFEYSVMASIRAKVVWERKVLELSVTIEAALLIKESWERFSTCRRKKQALTIILT